MHKDHKPTVTRTRVSRGVQQTGMMSLRRGVRTHSKSSNKARSSIVAESKGPVVLGKREVRLTGYYSPLCLPTRECLTPGHFDDLHL